MSYLDNRISGTLLGQGSDIIGMPDRALVPQLLSVDNGNNTAWHGMSCQDAHPSTDYRARDLGPKTHASGTVRTLHDVINIIVVESTSPNTQGTLDGPNHLLYPL